MRLNGGRHGLSEEDTTALLSVRRTARVETHGKTFLAWKRCSSPSFCTPPLFSCPGTRPASLLMSGSEKKVRRPASNCGLEAPVRGARAETEGRTAARIEGPAAEEADADAVRSERARVTDGRILDGYVDSGKKDASQGSQKARLACRPARLGRRWRWEARPSGWCGLRPAVRPGAPGRPGLHACAGPRRRPLTSANLTHRLRECTCRASHNTRLLLPLRIAHRMQPCVYGSCIRLSMVQWASTDATLTAPCGFGCYCSSCFFLPKPILNALLLRRARLLNPVAPLILRPSPLPPE